MALLRENKNLKDSTLIPTHATASRAWWVFVQVILIGGGVYLFENTIDPLVQEKTKTVKEWGFLGEREDTVLGIESTQSEVSKNSALRFNAVKTIHKLNKEFKEDYPILINLFGPCGARNTNLATKYVIDQQKSLKERQDKVPYRYLQAMSLFNADNLYALDGQYREFARGLGVDIRGKTTASIKHFVDEELAKTRRSDWTIGFLNVSSDNEFKSLKKRYFPVEIPCSSSNGTVIVTSQKALGGHPINVEEGSNKLEESEAIALFQDLVKDKELIFYRDEVTRLVNKLGRLPSLIKHVAICITNCKPSSQRGDKNNALRELLSTLEKHMSETKECQRVVLKLILEKAGLSREALETLCCFTFFGTQSISYSISFDLVNSVFSQNSSKKNAVIDDLIKWGFI